MSHLPIEHPDIHTCISQVGVSVQIGSNNPFGRITVDQVIEETMNKDIQTPGGTKDFSLKEGVVTRYSLSSEYRSRCLRQTRDMTGEDDTNFRSSRSPTTKNTER